ncbi:site-specific recombinase XerD [Herbaspirillum sp. CF444]|uniref:site-specific integrase n=1 Tax=Herbaspirillum sp. CF444 TaxID=1144319 RepID=UPI0002727E20|nr:site-specific integrase [Herbaspirillum sp. CF444]EJL93513.1 site-specific recombinase XerD [Herbaspirillum sp. CF444]
MTGFPAISEIFDTKAQATSWATEQEADMKARKFQAPRIIADKTLDFLIGKYVEEFGTAKPFGKNKAAVLQNLKLALGDVLLPYLTGDRLIEFVKVRLAGSETKAAAGGVTIAIDLTYLKTVLKVTKEMWRYPVDLTCIDQARQYLKHVGISTKSEERTRRPSLLEIENLCTYFKIKQRQVVPMWDLIPFAIGTAMRLDEIINLKWADLNEVDRTIIIRDRKHPRAKKGNDQEVPLLGDTFDIVKRQPRNEKEPRIFPVTEGTVSSIFPRACKELKIEDVRFHDLRHEGVSRLFEQGYQIHQVALVSGHKDWKMLARYTQIRAKDLHRS